jgi:hypothetical protein
VAYATSIYFSQFWDLEVKVMVPVDLESGEGPFPGYRGSLYLCTSSGRQQGERERKRQRETERERERAQAVVNFVRNSCGCHRQNFNTSQRPHLQYHHIGIRISACRFGGDANIQPIKKEEP